MAGGPLFDMTSRAMRSEAINHGYWPVSLGWQAPS
jgi:hypothetical protein